MKVKSFLLIILFTLVYSQIVFSEKKKTIDLVFCVDLSGSTNGLVDDVRDQLWDLINQVHTYRPPPDFRIGVVAFSRPSFGKENGFVKILSPLTNNYESLAFELAKLKPDIEKGDQLVGLALKAAVSGMRWSKDEQAIKTIFLIGNGHVSLDGMRYKEAYEMALQQKIIVHTIYCMSSNFRDEIMGWREIAKSTGGIPNELLVHKRNSLILTCKDTARLHDLNKKLLSTYVYYGKKGKDVYKMEELIDRTSLLANEMTFQSRMYYKISDLYQLKQSDWDLVDYIKLTNADLKSLQPLVIPDSLKSYTPDALKVLVINKKQERQKIINEMRNLLQYDRQQIINRTIEENNYDKNPSTLDRMVIGWMNQAAAEKGFETFVH